MLKDTLAKFFKVDSLIDNVTGYVEARVELLKIEAKEEIAKNLASALVFGAIAFIGALVVIFLSVAVGLKLSEHLGGLAGFSIIAAFYLVVGGVLFLNRVALTRNAEERIRARMNKKSH